MLERICSDGVDDLMGLCGNKPGTCRLPGFAEGRKARRQWLLDVIERLDVIGMLAYAGVEARAEQLRSDIPQMV